MARVTHVKAAQQRYAMIPVLDDDGTPKRTAVTRRNGNPRVTKTGREVVRKVTAVDKTQPLPNRVCEKCRTEITVGSPYKWIQPKSGPYGGRKRFRCAACPTWRQSETTSSGALAALYGAQEAADDALADWDREDVDTLRTILTDAAEGAREAASVYRESAENMESGFGHATAISDELNEKADALDSEADDIEYVDIDEFEFDEDTARDEAETDARAEYVAELADNGAVFDGDPATHEAWDQDEYERRVEALIDEARDEARDEWASDQEAKVSDAVSELGSSL